MRRWGVAGMAAIVAAGCGVQEVTAPVPQPDTIVFGRVAMVREVEGEAGQRGQAWEVEIKGGLPESLQAVMRRDGRPIPVLEADLVVKARVTPDTVCVAEARNADLEAFKAGQEVAVVPRPGSSAMVGAKLLTLDAAELYQFRSYQARFLPRALDETPAELTGRADAAKVNSSGLERTPIPLAGGKVLYFAAGLLPPIKEEAAPRGAVRAGMAGEAGLAPWAVGGWRPYRSEWTGSAWSAPQAVLLPGLSEDASAAVTWVNDGETSLLVEVRREGEPIALLASRRGSPREPWGALEKVERAAGESIGDGQAFAADDGALVWTSHAFGSSDLWLAMPGQPGAALEPRINTLGPEWAPRVGPNTTLFFCRAERQLVFTGGVVREVRLPGAQRRPLLEAAPTRTGDALFLRYPAFYAPAELDWDVAVAPRDGEGWGVAVPADEWRPR